VRSTRRSRPAGYVGQIFTMPLPLALLVAAANPAWWPVLPIAVAIRGFAAWFVAERVLRANLNWLLVPVEDIAALLFCIAGFFGNTITWRGRRYKLFTDGRFELLPD